MLLTLYLCVQCCHSKKTKIVVVATKLLLLLLLMKVLLLLLLLLLRQLSYSRKNIKIKITAFEKHCDSETKHGIVEC